MSVLTLNLRPARAAVRTAEGAPAAGAELRRTVAWSTVLPLAIVLSIADAYWMTGVRGAVGAIQRTQTPFHSFLLDSAFGIPLFTAAVIAAFGLAAYLFGPVLTSLKSVIGTAVLVIGAATLTGMAGLGSSAVYDYVLQAGENKMMNFMAGGTCNAICHHNIDGQTLHIQLKAMILGLKLLLITNAVLVAWLVAMRGGRIQVSRVAGNGAAASFTRTDNLRLLVAAGLFGSAIIHGLVATEEMSAWPAAGAFFLFLSGAQLVLAARLFIRPTRFDVAAAAVLTAGSLALWIYTRIAGLPFGPVTGVHGQAGISGYTANVLGASTFIAAAVLLRAHTWLAGRASVLAHARWFGAIAVAGITALGLAASLPI